MRIAEGPLAPFGQVLLATELQTNLAAKPALIAQAVNALVGAGCVPEEARGKAELCFDEALANAMTHGNCLDRKKKVRLTLFADAEWWGAILVDEGAGFDPTALPDPEEEESLLGESGRGIQLMNRYLDDLVYAPKGNELLMVRRRDASGGTALTPAAEAAASTPGGPPSPAATAAPPAAEVETIGPARVWAEGGGVIVEVTAPRLNEENVTGLKQALEYALQLQPAIVIDLAAVQYLSSLVIGAFVAYFKRTKEEKGALGLCSAQTVVRDTLRGARMDKVLPIAADRAQALKMVLAARRPPA
ncbi:MAG: ATP-binding protein [Planctomycetes bacterium]|nr:ATP-binding protein [Planctomycetota bacterium]